MCGNVKEGQFFTWAGERSMHNHTRNHFPDSWIRSAEHHPYFADRDRISDDQRDDRGTNLSRQAILLLLVNGLFTAAGALSGTFLNVYLWKLKESLLFVGWFAIAVHVAGALTFLLAGKWVKEYNKMNSLRLGVALSAVFYFVVLLLETRAVAYIWLLGALQGMASGFFWLSFNVVYFEVTGPDNRDKFNGWAGLLGSLSNMIAPWLSGMVITRMTEASGYRVIFSISLGIFVTGVIVSFFLKKRKADSQYAWKHCWKMIRQKGNPWRHVLPALMSQGVREGVFTFLIGLLVYIATRDEMKVGNYWLITSAVALFSFWAAGKFLTPRNRSRFMMVGTLAMVAVILPFFWDVNYTTLLVFGVGTALFIPLFTVPMTSTVFDIIGRDQDSATHKVEYVVIRELGLNIGRIVGIILFIVVVSWRNHELVLSSLLLIIGSFPVLSWWFIHRTLRCLVPVGRDNSCP